MNVQYLHFGDMTKDWLYKMVQAIKNRKLDIQLVKQDLQKFKINKIDHGRTDTIEFYW